MTMIARALLICGAFFLFSTGAGAQELAGTPQPIVRVPGVPLSLARIQARQKAQAAEIRREWLASGHTLQTTDDPPVVLSGKILTPTVDVAVAPAAPSLGIKFKTGSPGLAYIDATFTSSASNQHLDVSYSTPFGARPLTQGILTIQQPGVYGYGEFGLYSAPGTWTLSKLMIGDKTGNFTTYDQTQVAALFPRSTLRVTNAGSPDIAPPIVTAGSILTPVVHLNSANPSFAATLTVSDNVSGVIQPVVFVLAPGEESDFGFLSTPPAPVMSGTLTTYDFLAGHPTGVWTIVGYEACDVAGNCLDDFDASDVQALFGTTTFLVKN